MKNDEKFFDIKKFLKRIFFFYFLSLRNFNVHDSFGNEQLLVSYDIMCSFWYNVWFIILFHTNDYESFSGNGWFHIGLWINFTSPGHRFFDWSTSCRLHLSANKSVISLKILKTFNFIFISTTVGMTRFILEAFVWVSVDCVLMLLENCVWNQMKMRITMMRWIMMSRKVSGKLNCEGHFDNEKNKWRVLFEINFHANKFRIFPVY